MSVWKMNKCEEQEKARKSGDAERKGAANKVTNLEKYGKMHGSATSP